MPKKIEVGCWVGDLNGRSGIVKSIKGNDLMVDTTYNLDIIFKSDEVVMVAEGREDNGA